MKKQYPYLLIQKNQIGIINTPTIEIKPLRKIALLSVFFGCLAISLSWLTLVNYGGFYYLVILITIAIFVIFLGLFSSLGIFYKGTDKSYFGDEVFGFYGFLLGLAAIIVSIVMYFLGQGFLWG